MKANRCLHSVTRRKKIEAKWLARTLKRKWHLLPSAEIGIRKISFGTKVTVNRVSCQTLGEEVERIWDMRTYAFKPELYIYIKFCQPVKEKILSEGTRRKAKYCNYIFSPSQFKERRKKRKKRKKDIYSYVLSADNIAITLNMCVHVYIKKPCHISMSPHVEIYSLSACQVVYFMLSLSVSFTSRYSRLNCPILSFKNIIRETRIVDYLVNIIISKPRGSYLPLS